MSITASASTIALNGWRFFTIGEGIALMLVSGISVVDAFAYAWPPVLKISITMRWLGRFGIVAFITVFEWERLGHRDINWYTPVASASLSVLLLGVWLGRKDDFMWRDIESLGIKGTREPL